MNRSSRIPPAFALLAVTAWGAEGRASEHQFILGPLASFAWSDGGLAAMGGQLAVHAAYDVTDAFRLYGNVGYGLAAGNAAATPRHTGVLGIGLAYVLDIASFTPWIGAGLQGSIVYAPSWTGPIPALEVRGGIDYLASRYFGLMFQASYAISVASRDRLSDALTVGLGLRWTIDL